MASTFQEAPRLMRNNISNHWEARFSLVVVMSGCETSNLGVCAIYIAANEFADVVKRRLSFQMSIFSLSNSPGRPSYGSGTVSVRFRGVFA